MASNSAGGGARRRRHGQLVIVVLPYLDAIALASTLRGLGYELDRELLTYSKEP